MVDGENVVDKTPEATVGIEDKEVDGDLFSGAAEHLG